MFYAREVRNVFLKSSKRYSIFLIHFSVCKNSHISYVKVAFFKPEQVILLILTPDLPTLHRRPFLIKKYQSTLYHRPPRCTNSTYDLWRAGLSPIIFQPVEKIYPAHHDLSERARPIPAVFQTNLRSQRSRLAHCRSVNFSRAGDSGGWSALWCEEGVRNTALFVCVLFVCVYVSNWSHNSCDEWEDGPCTTGKPRQLCGCSFSNWLS